MGTDRIVGSERDRSAIVRAKVVTGCPIDRGEVGLWQRCGVQMAASAGFTHPRPRQ